MLGSVGSLWGLTEMCFEKGMVHLPDDLARGMQQRHRRACGLPPAAVCRYEEQKQQKLQMEEKVRPSSTRMPPVGRHACMHAARATEAAASELPRAVGM